MPLTAYNYSTRPSIWAATARITAPGSVLLFRLLRAKGATLGFRRGSIGSQAVLESRQVLWLTLC
jgi:hypothetical protein